MKPMNPLFLLLSALVSTAHADTGPCVIEVPSGLRLRFIQSLEKEANQRGAHVRWLSAEGKNVYEFFDDYTGLLVSRLEVPQADTISAPASYRIESDSLRSGGHEKFRLRLKDAAGNVLQTQIFAEYRYETKRGESMQTLSGDIPGFQRRAEQRAVEEYFRVAMKHCNL